MSKAASVVFYGLALIFCLAGSALPGISDLPSAEADLRPDKGQIKRTDVAFSGADGRTFVHRQKLLYEFFVEQNPDIIPSDSAATLALYPEAGLVRGVPSNFLFNSIQNFNKWVRGPDIYSTVPSLNFRLVLDLPRGIDIYSLGLYARRFTRVTEAGADVFERRRSPRGEDYNRFVIPFAALTHCLQLPLKLLTDLPAGKKKPGYYHLEWDGGKQSVQTFDIRVYDRPQIAAPERFIAGLYFRFYNEDNPRRGSIFDDPNAAHILQAFHGLGLNTFIIVNRWDERRADLPRMDRLIRQVRAAGMEPALHVCGLHDAHKQARKEGAESVNINGENAGAVCPSYRGPAYQEMIKTWGDAVSHGIYWIDNDWEDWNYREHTICFDQRCKDRFRAWLKENRSELEYRDPQQFERSPQKFPGLHRAWFDFKNSLIIEWHGDLRAELQRNMRTRGVSRPGFPRIGITQSLTHWDWKRMTQTVVDYVSPMIYAYLGHYAEPTVETCGRLMLSYRKRVEVDRHKYVVTIAPGERFGTALVPDKAMMYQILEVAGCGGAGFKIWYEDVLNGGKYYWMAKALGMIQPVEDILLDGEMAEASCNVPTARVRFFRHERGTVLFAAEYGLGRTELNLSEEVTVPSKVFDLGTGEEVAAIGPGRNSFKIVLDENRAALFFIGTRQQWNSLPRREVTARRSAARSSTLPGYRCDNRR